MVAVEAFHVELFEQSMAAHHLDGVVANLGGHLGAIELGHGGFLSKGTMLVFEPAGVIQEVSGGFDLHGHVGELESYSLELGIWLILMLLLNNINLK